jgi:hypothetical protein
MPILLDGNNLLHRLRGAHGRADVRHQVLDACRGQRRRVTVVFDGPPPSGTPARESLGPVTVVYSGARPADDVIVSRVPAGPRGREWVVVTDDRGLARRARARGASIRSLADWLSQSPPMDRPTHDRGLAPDDVAAWEAYFAEGRSDDDE